MKAFVKIIVTYFVAGLAIEAGTDLWKNVLKTKTGELVTNIKTKLQKKKA